MSLENPTAALDHLFAVEPSGAGKDHYQGTSAVYGMLGIYGGHFLGQALHVGLLTVEEPKLTHSVHAYFVKGGNPEIAIDYQVTRVKEGRNYETRLITASQQDHVVFTMLASFKRDEPGDQHADPMPRSISAEETVARRVAAGTDRLQLPFMIDERMELELISDFPAFDQAHKPSEPSLQMWMRIRELAGNDPRMNQVLLAYLADGTLMFNSVRPHGIPFMTHRMTSLDQSIWFYHPHSVNDWMFFDQKSTVAADARGLNIGNIYTADGDVVLTATQESMLRRNS